MISISIHLRIQQRQLVFKEGLSIINVILSAKHSKTQVCVLWAKGLFIYYVIIALKCSQCRQVREEYVMKIEMNA